MTVRGIKKAQKWMYAAIAVYFLMAIYTAFWPKTNAKVLEYSKVTQNTPERYLGKGATRPASSYEDQSIVYRYQVDGNQYKGSTVCICFPIGHKIQIYGDTVPVYYWPMWPSIALVSPGVHFGIPAVLIAIALGLGGLAGFMKRHS